MKINGNPLKGRSIISNFQPRPGSAPRWPCRTKDFPGPAKTSFTLPDVDTVDTARTAPEDRGQSRPPVTIAGPEGPVKIRHPRQKLWSPPDSGSGDLAIVAHEAPR